MISERTIDWKPLSKKHLIYIAESLRQENRNNCAEGAIRSGKTIDNCYIAYKYLEYCPDRLHLASGSTVANAKLNIGVCNGFGLEYLFRGRCHWGKYKDNEALFINSRTGEKIVIFVGGGKADSYKKILGNSYGLWIATEINLHYDGDDSETSFIKVAMGRQAAAIDYKRLWDLNPSAPTHKIYTDFIDKWRNENNIHWQHFLLSDNLSISEERKKEIEKTYDKESIWYKRDILGQRVVAEGVIYQTFAGNNKRYMLTKEQFEEVRKDIIEIECGVDFGGNKSKNTFVAVGFTRFYKDVIVLKSVRLDGELNPDELNKAFIIFCENVYNKYKRGFNVNFDNAEPVLARGLKNAAYQANCPCNVIPAFKNPILQRIKLVMTLISQNRLWYLEGECDSFVDAMVGAVWDSKHPDTRLDDGTSDIDTLDAFEYSIEKKTQLLLQQNQSLIKEKQNGLSRFSNENS